MIFFSPSSARKKTHLIDAFPGLKNPFLLSAGTMSGSITAARFRSSNSPWSSTSPASEVLKALTFSGYHFTIEDNSIRVDP